MIFTRLQKSEHTGKDTSMRVQTGMLSSMAFVMAPTSYSTAKWADTTDMNDKTINYLDTCGLPLTSEHLGSAVALCLQMLRENIGNNVDQAWISSLQSVLTDDEKEPALSRSPT